MPERLPDLERIAAGREAVQRRTESLSGNRIVRRIESAAVDRDVLALGKRHEAGSIGRNNDFPPQQAVFVAPAAFDEAVGRIERRIGPAKLASSQTGRTLLGR